MLLAGKTFYGVLFFGLSAMLCAVFPVIGNAMPGQADYQYVINVDLSYDKKDLGGLDEYKKQFSIYRVKVRISGKIWYRTRLGFFSSRKEANKYLSEIKSGYKLAWIDRTKKYDQKYLANWYRLKHQASPVAKESIYALDTKASQELMEQARTAVAQQNYEKAVRLYTKAISRGHVSIRQDAQEFLGVSREKNGQYAHAKAEYEEYLHLYPEGEGAERVRQRLAGIKTARYEPRDAMKKANKKENVVWETYGSLFEFYRRDKVTSNGITTENPSMTSSLGLFARRRSDESDIRMEMTGTHLYDIDTPEAGNDSRLTSLYLDYANRPKTVSFRVGRQSRNTSGILGRMDGVWADYQFHPQWKINAFAGYPVELSMTNSVQTNRKFYGLSLDLGTFDKYWDFNLFILQQTVDDITDRSAVGGEIRYISPGSIYFTQLDYDTYFDELNRAFFIGSWFFKNQSSVNLTLNYGKNPYLMTVNALQGQAFTTIEEMSSTYKKSEIRQIARDRTADYKSITINGSLPLTKVYTLTADISLSNLSALPESANVPETPSTGDEYYYGMQLIGTGLFSTYDTLIGEVRYSDTKEYQRSAYSISERFKFLKNWRMKLKYTQEYTDRTNGTLTTANKPELGLDYIYSARLRLETDLYYEKSSTTGGVIESSDNYFSFNLGVLYDF